VTAFPARSFILLSDLIQSDEAAAAPFG